jgi:hypothetical protein
LQPYVLILGKEKYKTVNRQRMIEKRRFMSMNEISPKTHLGHIKSHKHVIETKGGRDVGPDFNITAV